LNRFHKGILFDEDELIVSSRKFTVGRDNIGTTVVVAARILGDIDDCGDSDECFCGYFISFSSLFIFVIGGIGNGAIG
ncbi:unnamed protein product, partial [Rotaria magnacalcarata]